MKLAIVSDVHFGDDNCVLIDSNLQLGSKFNEFKTAAGQNDYLVILGDALDISIAHYHEVYEIARAFFNLVLEHNIADKIIYVPGNHDFEFWHILEHEVNVIKPVLKGDLPREFRYSVPGMFDDREANDRDKFSLPDVTPNPDPNLPKYGDVFLAKLSNYDDRELNFNVAYPNLYIVGKNGDSVLLTHGHYFESTWSIVGEWAFRLFKKELRETGETNLPMSLQEIVSFNFPMTQFLCSGVGQAGDLTPVVRKLQQLVKTGQLDDIKTYLNRLDSEILDKEVMAYNSLDPREWASDAAIGLAKSFTMGKLKGYKEARFNKRFMEDDSVRDRFKNYYRASLIELDRLRTLENDRAVDIPIPKRVIFGHTHQPTPWKDKQVNINISGRKIYLHNTGGWLTKKENSIAKFCGAEIFFYESDKGFYSQSIN